MRAVAFVVAAVILLLLGGCVLLMLTMLAPEPVSAGCERYEPVPPHEPTGIKGCEVYGEGIASRWPGPGVARNDCVWPWVGCRAIRITSLDTGLSMVVTPTMYCDCYTGTPNERIVDLDAYALGMLGLDWRAGLYPVRVEPAAPILDLPNTAMAP